MREFLVVIESGAQIRAKRLWFGTGNDEDHEFLCYTDLDGHDASVAAPLVVCIAPVLPVPKEPTPNACFQGPRASS